MKEKTTIFDRRSTIDDNRYSMTTKGTMLTMYYPPFSLLLTIDFNRCFDCSRAPRMGIVTTVVIARTSWSFRFFNFATTSKNMNRNMCDRSVVQFVNVFGEVLRTRLEWRAYLVLYVVAFYSTWKSSERFFIFIYSVRRASTRNSTRYTCDTFSNYRYYPIDKRVTQLSSERLLQLHSYELICTVCR